MDPSPAKTNCRRAILQAKTHRHYIVDFHAPAARLVVELDGSHHFDLAQARYDAERTEYLEKLRLKVLRFDNRQVLMETESVVEEIFRAVSEKKILPNLPFTKGGT